jgi:methionine-rich copper-binding protein CopC
MRIRANWVIGLSLLLPISAHAAPAAPGLITTDPEPNAVVSAPLYMIHLMFNLPVDVASAVFEVTDKSGKRVDVGQAMPMDNEGKTVMAMPGNPLPAGTYNVKWHATGKDGKLLQGEFTFTAR